MHKKRAPETIPWLIINKTLPNKLCDPQEKIPIQTTFQSRFGPQEWLQPYTDKTLENLPKEGKKNILVVCPGFSSDCVETLEEIAIQGKNSFFKNGGENFDIVPCLNDDEEHINLLKHLVDRYNLKKWTFI